jgi:hypothetical protein
MRRWNIGTATALGLGLSLAWATATTSAQGLFSGDIARQFGLERVWFTQANVNRAHGELAGTLLHISNTQARHVYEVKFAGGSLRVSESDLSPFGEPWGAEGAKARADRLAQDLTQQGHTPEIIEHIIPHMTLYLSTSRGVVDALDAETGRRLWTTFVGNSNYPTSAPAADDTRVALTNGSTLYVLDARDGRVLWKRRTRSVPGGGPAINDWFVFVPTVSGAMEAYTSSDATRPPSIYKATGRALIQPIFTARTVAWPTDRGHLYVAPSNREGIWYRIEATKEIVAQPAYSHRTLYIPSVDGYIYAVDEVSGSILWTYSTGEELRQRPMAIGDSLYVVGDEENLYCLDAISGQLRWSTPQIRQLLAVGAEQRMYCVGLRHNLVIVDTNTGSPIEASYQSLPRFRITNHQTDRVFLASPGGLLQCYREAKAEFPSIHVDLSERPTAAPPATTTPATPAEPGANPFDTPMSPANPFGAPPAGEANPFGAPPAGGANPFGAPAAPTTPNPFGPRATEGGANPFGTP